MQPAIVEARPPYVKFERVAIEDRAASEEKGRYVARDQDWAYVTPQGSKDRIPRVVSEWLPYLQQQVKEGRFPEVWYNAYKEAYARWKQDQSVPENGTPILTWPAVSPAMAQNLLVWNIRTVEDLASANEEAIGRIGMGGRALKQQAVEWLRAASNIGASAQVASNLTAENAALQAQNILLREQLKVLQASLSTQEHQAVAAEVMTEPSSADQITSDDLLSDAPTLKPL